MPFFAVTNELLKRSFIVVDWKIAKALKTLMPIANVSIFENQEEANTHVAAFRDFVLKKKCKKNDTNVEKKQFENPNDPNIHIERINIAFNDLHSSVKLSPMLDDHVNGLKTDVFTKLNTLMSAIEKKFVEDIKSPKKLPTSKPFTPRTIDEQHSMSSVSFNILQVATNILPDSLNTSPSASPNQSLTSTQLSTDKGNTKLTPTNYRNIRKRKKKALDSIVSSVALHNDNNCSEISIDENHVHAETTSDNLDDSTVLPSKIPRNEHFTFETNYCDGNIPSIEEDMEVINEILGDTPVQQTAIPRSETSTTAPANKAVKSFNHLQITLLQALIKPYYTEEIDFDKLFQYLCYHLLKK